MSIKFGIDECATHVNRAGCVTADMGADPILTRQGEVAPKASEGEDAEPR